MTKCPKSLHYLQTLAFLPNVLDINAPWSVLDIQTVASRCGIPTECFFSSKSFLAQALANSPEFSLLCTKVLKYRLEKKQDCCTALRSMSTWNVSGWRTLQWTNPKTRAILRRARKGIVCLQETRWTASTATSFLQTFPGFDLAHTPAIATEYGGLSGGVAILIPCTFRLLREVVVTPGKIIAAQVQTGTDCFWVLSVLLPSQQCQKRLWKPYGMVNWASGWTWPILHRRGLQPQQSLCGHMATTLRCCQGRRYNPWRANILGSQWFFGIR